MQPNDHEWKREVHSYVDKQIEAHNTANQREFQRLRDGQLALQGDIGSLETNLTSEVRSVKDASAEAHKEIIARLERLENGTKPSE